MEKKLGKLLVKNEKELRVKKQVKKFLVKMVGKLEQRQGQEMEENLTLKLDLMVWISLVPQWRIMEVNIFGYLNGNCSIVPLFREDSQVSINAIELFLPSKISFTLPPLEGTDG